MAGSDRAKLVLASASPRRRALLAQIGIEPEVVEPADIDESVAPGELPAAHAARLAEAKARHVSARHGGAFVLGADTVVACGRRILPKAETEDQARACLANLSGRRHRVFTALCLFDPDGRAHRRIAETVVMVKRLAAAEIDAYIESDEWRGKAGGYAIQGRAAAFIRWINGSHSNVVGLPLFEVNALLAGHGWRPASG